jgi:Family of unknown function (DUF6065)
MNHTEPDASTEPNVASTGPIVRFYRAIPESFAPMRADRAALGWIPHAAVQYCEALTTASAFGWYLFSPMTFYLQWDGTDVIWTHDDAETWYPLAMEHFPTRSFFPGVVQVWSGLFVKTAPGWSLLVRPPVNLPRSQMYECYEGIIETDCWFGPLFINLRLTATDRPIEINHKKPLFQAQQLLRETYADARLHSFAVVEELSLLSAEDWNGYRETIVKPNRGHYREVGRYAATVRKRGKHAASEGGER